MLTWLFCDTGCTWRPARAAFDTIPAYVATGVILFLGILSKENLATVPVVLGLAELTLFRQKFQGLAKKALIVALITVPPAAAYILGTQVSSREAGAGSWELSAELPDTTNTADRPPSGGAH